MSTYSIRDLERISSLKAHTIRIWEQRYGILEPERTETNIRFYNDEQLKKLLNVCTLINNGMKISKVSKLNMAEIAAEIDKIIGGSFQSDVHVEALINQALISISTYDVALFDSLFLNSVKRFGLKKTYIRIIYPLLVRTGLLWIKGDLLPSQEHFLSNLIRQKLFAAIDELPAPHSSGQKWILFLNEEEDHEIGLLFAYYMIRLHGKSVIYLGARVPYHNLYHVVNECKPTHIYSFFVGNKFENKVSGMLENLRKDFPDAGICISGGDEKIIQIALKNRITHIGSIDGLIDILNDQNDE